MLVHHLDYLVHIFLYFAQRWSSNIDAPELMELDARQINQISLNPKFTEWVSVASTPK